MSANTTATVSTGPGLSADACETYAQLIEGAMVKIGKAFVLIDELESTGVAPDARRGIGELAEVAAVLRHNGYGYFNQ